MVFVGWCWSQPPPEPNADKATWRPGGSVKGTAGHLQAGQSGDDVFFKIKRNTPLSKLMRAYCSRAGVDISAVRFMFDGSRVREDMTAEQLEMEDGDEIDVMAEQVGGQ